MSGFAECEDFDAVGLAELVRKREVSARELLEAAIARVKALNPQLNAVPITMYDQAQAALDAGLPDGPLAGVPFLLKDLGAAYAGAPLTYGSRLFADFVPDQDAEIVLRYRRAGLVVFGRSNAPEMGLSYSTEPSLWGPTRNPWSLDHSPGGSSGGAAAAVAARIVPAAHATDGGGSIRAPASCCGVFGLKPTRGRTPAGPFAGEGWAGMSTFHVVTLSVRDSAALLDAAAGPDVGDPYWAPPPARPYAEEVGAAAGALRIAVSGEPVNDVAVAGDCIAAMERAAALCAELGHRVEQASPAYEREAVEPARTLVIAANVKAQIDQRAALRGRAVARDELEPTTWPLVEAGAKVAGSDYVAAVQTLHRVGRQVARFFLDYDVLLTPALAAPPVRIGVLDPRRYDIEAYYEAFGPFAAFLALSNVSGAPAMSVPLHWNDAGLPIGVQFVGRFGDEATLLRLAAQLEEAAPWAGRRPPLEPAG